MALLDDILNWSAGLVAWQRDGLRRLFINGMLSPEDTLELVEFAKESHGCGPAADRRPEPLTAEHVPVSTPGASVQLLRLDRLRNVNHFPEGREVQFMPDQLNVLFGENGAGKSGYARILKNACRARHRQPVLPDAFDVTQPRPTPSAGVVFIEDGNERRFFWSQGGAGEPALGRVAVYDSACGADYLSKEGVSEFQPFGLPHLNRLVTAQREIQALIGRERDQITINANVFADMHGEHEVGQFFSGLGATSDIERLRELSTLTPDDLKRIEELAQILGAMNPEPDARSAERLAERLGAAAATAQAAQLFLTDPALDEVMKRKQDQEAAQGAWVFAQQKLQQREDGSNADFLQGTGNNMWKALFYAAEKFSVQYAYPEHAHPNVGDGAKCVLCQSSLDDSAKSRMLKFSAHVVNEASQAAQDTALRMMEIMQRIENSNLSPLDTPTLQDLAAVDTELHQFSIIVAERWNARRQWVKDAVESNDWTVLRPLLPNGDALDERLRIKVISLQSHARDLRAALDVDAKARLEVEKKSLVARERLSGRIQEVEQHIANSQKHEALSACYIALDTRGLSRKITELAETYVTNALAKAMNDELTALGYKRKVEPMIVGRTDVGQTMVTLKIKGCENGAQQVLSEGEQRAMGLALFLAEVRLQGHTSTIAFDDPSTSLDHHHRRHMAERVATLGRDRQVIVFTHDAVFLTEVDRFVRKNGQPVCFQTIEWSDKKPGFAKEGMTWETANWQVRMTELEKIAKEVNEQAGDYMDEALKNKVKDTYTKMRGTIERAVRDVYMNNAVLPFMDEVSVGSFGVVFYHSKEEWDRLMETYDRCCEVTDAHDTNPDHQLVIPDAAQLQVDLASMKMLIASADRSRKKFNGARSEEGAARKKAFVQRQ